MAWVDHITKETVKAQLRINEAKEVYYLSLIDANKLTFNDVLLCSQWENGVKYEWMETKGGMRLGQKTSVFTKYENNTISLKLEFFD